MKNPYALVFGGILSFILLILYTITMGYIILEVFKAGQSNTLKPIEFSNGVVYVVTTIGGLFSALVIAKLSITKPGDNPGRLEMAPDEKWVTGLVWAYLIIWLLTGIATLIFGVMLYPKLNQTLNDMGTTWLGLAVASGFAYFGIKPPPTT